MPRLHSAISSCVALLASVASPSVNAHSPTDTLPATDPLDVLDEELSNTARSWFSAFSQALHFSARECSTTATMTLDCACLTWTTAKGSQVYIKRLRLQPTGAYTADAVWLQTANAGTYFVETWRNSANNERLSLSNLQWHRPGSSAVLVATTSRRPHAQTDDKDWVFTDITWQASPKHGGDAHVSCDTPPPLLGSSPRARASSASPGSGGTWELIDLRAAGVRSKATQTDRQASGLIPPTLSITSSGQLSVWAPLFIARPSLFIAPLASNASTQPILGAALGYISRRKQDNSPLPVMLVFTANEHGETQAGAFGAAELSFGSQHINAELEWGPRELWQSFRHRNDAYTRTWQRSLAGINASTPGFALTAGLLDETLTAKTHAHARAASEFSINKETTAIVALLHRSIFPTLRADSTLSERIEASTQQTTAIAGARHQWGDRDRAWIRAGAGALLDYAVTHQPDAANNPLPVGMPSTEASSFGALVAIAAAGVSLEGRFNDATHRITPSVAALITPTSYDKSPSIVEEAVTRAGAGVLKLDQHLRVGHWTIHLPVAWFHTLTNISGDRYNSAYVATLSIAARTPSSVHLVSGLDLCGGALCGGHIEARGRIGWRTKKTSGALIASTASSQIMPLSWLTANDITLGDASLVRRLYTLPTRADMPRLGAEFSARLANHELRVIALTHDITTPTVAAALIEYAYPLPRKGWRLGAMVGASDITNGEVGLTVGWTN